MIDLGFMVLPSSVPFWILGLIGALFSAWYLAPKRELALKKVILFIGVCFLGGCLFARLGYAYVYWDSFRHRPIEILYIWQGGMVFYLGYLGGALSGGLLWVWMGGRLIQALDLSSVCVVVGHSFGRLGCFFYGCCYGVPILEHSKLAPLGVHFHGEKFLRHPTQLYEAAFLILLFVILFGGYQKLKSAPGLLSSIYLISYASFRFGNEFFRGDDRGQMIALTTLATSQQIAILMGLIGLSLGYHAWSNRDYSS